MCVESKDLWSDEALLHAADKGDEEAFETFCHRHLPLLNDFLKALCTAHDIDDDFIYIIIADSMIEKAVRWVRVNQCLPDAWKRRDRLRRIARYSFKAWLLDNRPDLMDRLRQGRSRLSPDQRRSRTAEEQLVLKFYGYLSSEQCRLLSQVLVRGQTVADAGRTVFGVEPSVAVVLYKDALKKINDFLHSYRDHPEDYN